MSKTLDETKRRRATAHDRYLKLVRFFPLRPLRTESEYERATALMMKIVLKGRENLTPGERDYLDALTIFVTRYDDQHHPITARSTPLQRLKYLLRENGMKTTDLGEFVGGRGQASLILNGKRELSKANIRALAERFKVSPALFL